MRGKKSCKTEIENGSNFDDSLMAIIDNLYYTYFKSPKDILPIPGRAADIGCPYTESAGAGHI